MAKRTRNRQSPAMMSALNYLSNNPDATAAILIEHAGVSRATAFNAIRKHKETLDISSDTKSVVNTKSKEKKVIKVDDKRRKQIEEISGYGNIKDRKRKKEDKEESKEDKRESSVRVTREIQPKKEPSAGKKDKRNKDTKRKQVGSIGSNSIVPKSLSRKPGFNLEGFHLNPTGDLKVEGKLLWADIAYKGVCPVCTRETDLFKNAISFSDSGKREVYQSYAGKCRHCDINISINRGRK